MVDTTPNSCMSVFSILVAVRHMSIMDIISSSAAAGRGSGHVRGHSTTPTHYIYNTRPEGAYARRALWVLRAVRAAVNTIYVLLFALCRAGMGPCPWYPVLLHLMMLLLL